MMTTIIKRPTNSRPFFKGQHRLNVKLELPNRRLTRGVVDHPEVGALQGQHLEHHVAGRLPAAVQPPRLEGLQGAAGRHVHHGPPQALAPRERLQHASRQAHGRAEVERHVGGHLRHVR